MQAIHELKSTRESQRVLAIAWLAESGIASHAASARVEKLAQRDPSPSVRALAVWALGLIQPDDDRYRTILPKLLAKETDRTVKNLLEEAIERCRAFGYAI